MGTVDRRVVLLEREEFAIHVLMAMLETAIFDRLFIKSNISAMDRLVVAKFHTNFANRWLFMIQ